MSLVGEGLRHRGYKGRIFPSGARTVYPTSKQRLRIPEPRSITLIRFLEQREEAGPLWCTHVSTFEVDPQTRAALVDAMAELAAVNDPSPISWKEPTVEIYHLAAESESLRVVQNASLTIFPVHSERRYGHLEVKWVSFNRPRLNYDEIGCNCFVFSEAVPFGTPLDGILSLDRVDCLRNFKGNDYIRLGQSLSEFDMLSNLGYSQLGSDPSIHKESDSPEVSFVILHAIFPLETRKVQDGIVLRWLWRLFVRPIDVYAP